MKKTIYELIINNNIQILHNNIKWYDLFLYSIAEKVEGYLFKVFLDNNALGDIPKPIRKNLYINFQYNQKKNVYYNKEFQHIQQTFSQNGIIAFPYKGLFLINNIYKDYGVRYMEDIDIISTETNYNILEELLKELNYQLVLINDNDISLYVPGTPIFSCLFIKNHPETSLIPFSKVDISFITIALKKYKTPYYNETGLLPRYHFSLLCESFFYDACEKNENPIPENCTLIKLVDIIRFIKKYPKEAEYVLNNSLFSDLEFIRYTQQCISYYSEGE